MSAAEIRSIAFQRGTNAIRQIIDGERLERLLSLQGEDWLEDRIAELAAKANEGELTEEERAEYEGYIEADQLISSLIATVRELVP